MRTYPVPEMGWVNLSRLYTNKKVPVPQFALVTLTEVQLTYSQVLLHPFSIKK